MLSQVRSSPVGEEWFSHSRLYQPFDRWRKGDSCGWKSAVTSASVRIVILGASSYRKEVLYSKCMVDLGKDKRVPLSL